MFEDTLLAFDGVRQEVFKGIGVGLRVDPTKFVMTSRTKTRGTLIDKLRMQPGLGLPYIRDIAGIRLVLTRGGGLLLQDEVAEQIRGLGLLESVKTIDRRSAPMHGYRAVHLTGTLDDLAVEIQVRTDIQGSWANLFERVGDMWGRQYRYNDLADIPKSERTTRDAVVQLIQTVSLECIGPIEGIELKHQRDDFRADERRKQWRGMTAEARNQIITGDQRTELSDNLRAVARQVHERRRNVIDLQTKSTAALDHLSHLLDQLDHLSHLLDQGAVPADNHLTPHADTDESP